MSGSMIDLESVQTLKGPQGTLFGRNTTGGALVMQTKNPERTLGGSVRAEYGSYDLTHYTGILNVPLNDKIALRFVADTSKQGTYTKQLDGKKFGDANSTTYRVKLSYEPDDLTLILLSAESVDQHGTSTLNETSQPNKPVYNNIPATVNGLPFALTLTDEKNK